MDKYESMWNIYKNIKEQIAFCDTKAAILLAFYGIIFSIVIPKIFQDINILLSNNVVFGGMIIISIPIFISILFIFKALMPRFSYIHSLSHIYINDISREFTSSNNYYESLKIQLQEPEEHLKDLSIQIWEVAKIADEKYQNVSIAIKTLFISIFLLIVSILFLLFSKI